MVETEGLPIGAVHAEIEYSLPNGELVHSDICPDECDPKNLADLEYRKFLHACLDEWLDKSRGTGMFYIQEEGYVFKQKRV